MEITLKIPRGLLKMTNQVYELENKISREQVFSGLARNIERLKESLLELGLFYENPIGQEFRDTRTDLEATIVGSSTDDLVVVEVIKPVIRAVIGDENSGLSKVVQKGVVLVESQRSN